MKVIKVEFWASTGFSGSEVTQIVEIEIDENLKEDEIDEQIKQVYEIWLYENIETSWQILD